MRRRRLEVMFHVELPYFARFAPGEAVFVVRVERAS